MNRKSIIKYLCILTCGITLFAESSASGDPHSGHNAILEFNMETISHIYPDTSLFDFINSEANVISDPAGTLIPAMEKMLTLRSGADSTLSILHIGDSHIQAGFWSERFRELIQNDFGNAGRGLIIPYKLSGTNEPRDYYIRTAKPFETAKATSNRFGESLGFTGTAIWKEETTFDFDLWSKEPFDAITVFHHPEAPALLVPDSLTPGSYCASDNTAASTRIVLSSHTDTLKMTGYCDENYNKPLYYGFSLENGKPGVLYHAIGSNGAAFEHFAKHTDITDGGAAVLNPDIIIISLATNNCYGRNYRTSHLRGVIEKFIGKMRLNYPNSAIIMTTPRESCKRSGRQYIPNPNIADAAKLITEISAEQEIACWDLYSAAGGKGVSEKWYAGGLAGRDRIHLSEKGYTLIGDMMYDALSSYYDNWLTTLSDNSEREVVSE